MLNPVKWLRCTEVEALYYNDLGYQVYKSNGQTFRPLGAQASVGGNNPNAFYEHFEDIVKAERGLENAGVSATHDEGLMAGIYFCGC